ELVASVRERLRDREKGFDVLLGEEWRAGGDLAEEREHPHLGLLRPSPTGQLEGARLRRIASEKTGSLQVRQMGVDGGRRREPDGFADLTHGRWVPVAVDVPDEEFPDLLLA